MGIQQQRILRAFENGERLTSLGAWQKYSISRLAARISELRMMGYPIEGFRRETVNQFGEPTHFIEYSMKVQKNATEN